MYKKDDEKVKVKLKDSVKPEFDMFRMKSDKEE